MNPITLYFSLQVKKHSLDLLFLVLCICSIIYVIYSGYSHPAASVPDYSATMLYVEYFLNQNSNIGSPFLPLFDYCWVCHHPPLYYWLCSKVMSFGIDLSTLSYVMSIITILVVYFLLRCFVFEDFKDSFWDRFIVLFLAMVYGLWPYTIIFSGSVHNDMLFNLLFLCSLLFFVKFEMSSSVYGSSIYFLCASIFSLLCFLTKATGFLLFFVGLGSVLYVFLSGLINGSGQGLLKTLPLLLMSITWLCLLIFVPIFVNVVGRDLEFSIDGGVGQLGMSTLMSLLLGNAGIVSQEFWVGNGLINYLWFDLGAYFYSPVMLSSIDDSGSQYFLNHFLKSSLFGSFNEYIDLDISYLLNRLLGFGLSLLLLLIVVLVVISFIVMFYYSYMIQPSLVVILGAGALLIVSIVSFSYTVPAPHHSDFSLVYPLLPILLCVLCMALTKPWYGKSLCYLYRGVTTGTLGMFMVLSFCYFLPLSGLSSYLFSDIASYEYVSLARPKSAGFRWDDPSNHIFAKNQIVRVDLFHFGGTPSYLELSTDSNEDYVIVLKSKNGGVNVFLKSVMVGSDGLSCESYELDWDKLGSGGLDYVLVYPLVFESSLGVAGGYGFNFSDGVNGDDSYSLGHLSLLP